MAKKLKTSQTFQVQKAEEVLKLSENKLISVLKGETSVPEKTVVSVALELYKKRIPQKAENEGSGSKLTLIKIVKNHVPDDYKPADTIDITAIEEAAEQVISEKAKELNEKLEKKRANRLSTKKPNKVDTDKPLRTKRKMPSDFGRGV